MKTLLLALLATTPISFDEENAHALETIRSARVVQFEFNAGGDRESVFNAAEAALEISLLGESLDVRPERGATPEWLSGKLDGPVRIRLADGVSFLNQIARAADAYWKVEFGRVIMSSEPHFVAWTHPMPANALSDFPELNAPAGKARDWARELLCDAAGTPTPQAGCTLKSLPSITFDPLLRRFDILSQEGDRERIAALLHSRFPPAGRIRVDTVWFAIPTADLHRELAGHPALTQIQLQGLYHLPGRRILSLHSTRLAPGEVTRIHAGDTYITSPLYRHVVNKFPAAWAWQDLASGLLTHNTGVEMVLRAEVSPEGNAVRMTLDADLGDLRRWLQFTPTPPAHKPAGDDVDVQTPVIRRFRNRTSFSCPNGGTMVMGGHTAPDSAETVFLSLTASIETPTTPTTATDPP